MFAYSQHPWVESQLYDCLPLNFDVWVSIIMWLDGPSFKCVLKTCKAFNTLYYTELMDRYVHKVDTFLSKPGQEYYKDLFVSQKASLKYIVRIIDSGTLLSNEILERQDVLDYLASKYNKCLGSGCLLDCSEYLKYHNLLSVCQGHNYQFIDLKANRHITDAYFKRNLIPIGQSMLYLAKNTTIPSDIIESIISQEIPMVNPYLALLAQNPAVTIEQAFEMFNRGLIRMGSLTRNPNITVKYIIEHPEIEWYRPCILGKSGLTDETCRHLIKTYHTEKGLQLYINDISGLSEGFIKELLGNELSPMYSTMISMRAIKDPKYPFSLALKSLLTIFQKANRFHNSATSEEEYRDMMLVERPLSYDNIRALKQNLTNLGLTSETFWDKVSSNPSVTYQLVSQNIQEPWSVRGLLVNPSITYTQMIRLLNHLRPLV